MAREASSDEKKVVHQIVRGEEKECLREGLEFVVANGWVLY